MKLKTFIINWLEFNKRCQWEITSEQKDTKKLKVKIKVEIPLWTKLKLFNALIHADHKWLKESRNGSNSAMWRTSQEDRTK